MPEPLAQIPVQATVLCSRLADSAANQSDCSLNVTQLALLKAQDQPTLVFFEASVRFNAYPWPAWSSASDSLVVDQGMSSQILWNLLKCFHVFSGLLNSLLSSLFSVYLSKCALLHVDPVGCPDTQKPILDRLEKCISCHK